MAVRRDRRGVLGELLKREAGTGDGDGRTGVKAGPGWTESRHEHVRLEKTWSRLTHVPFGWGWSRPDHVNGAGPVFPYWKFGPRLCPKDSRCSSMATRRACSLQMSSSSGMMSGE